MDKDLTNKGPWQEDDIQLPDQDAAWKNMEQKLDDDKRNKRIIPPFFIHCADWSTLMLALLMAGWFIIDLNKDHNKDLPGSGHLHEDQIKQPAAQKPSQTKDAGPTIGNSGAAQNSSNDKPNQNDIEEDAGNRTLLSNQEPGVNIVRSPGEDLKVKPGKVGEKKAMETLANKSFNKKKVVAVESKNEDLTAAGVIDPSFIQKPLQKGDPLKLIRLPLRPLPVMKIDSAMSLRWTGKEVEKNKKLKKDLVYSAGVGLQQQVPFSGQNAVPYNYYGRKGSLTDYIPSVFLKMGKEKQWFIMGEFRFGAPQSLKEFSFNRKTSYDTTTGQYIVTTLNLKKTYYHQLPLSFNYYVEPDFSVGIGGIYSRFYGAVTEAEVRKVNLQTQTESVSRKISRVPHYTDSFLYKTQVHLLVQASYHWKRFDLGLRFTKDIQPYIRYTTPDGHINEEKNQTFQLMVKYSLWKSED